MAQPIRAVYEKGQLRPLDPVDLSDGQRVRIIIAPEESAAPTPQEIAARLRLAGLLVDVDIPADAVELSSEERLAVGALFLGDRPLEDLIDEDRGNY